MDEGRGMLQPVMKFIIGMTRCIPPRHGPRPMAQGFVLPLALGASFLLLLGSASIHTLSLQGRLRVRAHQQRAAGADQLRSAAQAFAAAAQGPHNCLLALSSIAWDRARSICPEADPQRLRRGVLDAQPWRLISWQPSASRATLLLAMADGRQARLWVRLTEQWAIASLGEPQLLGRVDGEDT